MRIKTTELLKQELPEDHEGVTIAVNMPGIGQHIFTGIRHFHIVIEEEVEPEVFGVKEIFCVNEEFQSAVHGIVLRRLMDIVEP